MYNTSNCRWCKRPVEMSSEKVEFLDQLLIRLYYCGESSLTEDQQVLVRFGPLCEECEFRRGIREHSQDLGAPGKPDSRTSTWQNIAQSLDFQLADSPWS